MGQTTTMRGFLVGRFDYKLQNIEGALVGGQVEGLLFPGIIITNIAVIVFSNDVRVFFTRNCISLALF